MSERTDLLRGDVERLARGYAQNYQGTFAVRVEWWVDFKQTLRAFEAEVRADERQSPGSAHPGAPE